VASLHSNNTLTWVVDRVPLLAAHTAATAPEIEALASRLFGGPSAKNGASPGLSTMTGPLPDAELEVLGLQELGSECGARLKGARVYVCVCVCIQHLHGRAAKLEVLGLQELGSECGARLKDAQVYACVYVCK